MVMRRTLRPVTREPYVWLFDPARSGQVDPQCPIRIAMLSRYHQAAMGYVGQLAAGSTEVLAVNAAFNGLNAAFAQLQASVINAEVTLP